MSDAIKLYISCHKRGVHIPDNPLLVPIQVGSSLASERFDEMVQDSTGDNISAKNRSYCELTGQYWAWKNDDADYYGFLHYRRYFNFSNTSFPIHHEPFIFGDVVFESNDDDSLSTICFDEKTMREVICSHDFIAPEAIATPDGVNVYEQYRMSAGHHIEDFDTVLDVIERRYPEVWKSAQKYLAQDKLYVCNMFVMRKELFYNYSQFLFDVLSEHERLCDISHYAPVARRVSGYLGERLCGIYLSYLFDQGFDGIELQRVYFRNTDATSPVSKSKNSAVTAVDNEIKFGEITRGNGYIYTAITAEGISGEIDELDFVASSKTIDGKDLPAKVVVSEDHRPVLVLPVLEVDQRVSVDARKDGLVVARGEREFGHRSTALLSKRNTLLKNPVALSIRNCDKLPLSHDTLVRVTRFVLDPDGTDILQGEITLPLMPRDPEEAYLYVIAIDPNGNTVNIGDWVCTKDEIVTSSEYPGQKNRSIGFSLRVPRLPNLCVWARIPECELHDGFLNFHGGSAEGMRSAWRAMTTPASDEWDYDPWFRERHRSSQQELAWQRAHKFVDGPRFSIIVPLFRTPISFFREMVESVVKQTYSNWQLVLVNASPDDRELTEAVESFANLDGRVSVVSLERNLGITENTNFGIRAADGDFVCFFDHDDILEPDALFWYAAALDEHDDIDMFYCDEDKLDDGLYRQPFFKPDWNPELLLGMNYVCHFLAVRKSVLDQLELPGSEYDGSQDWHMTFRIGELARRVHHVPRVLYHWRVHKASTASSAEQKSYTFDSSRLSVESHLERVGVNGKVLESPIAPRRFIVEPDLTDEPLVSIIIPNKDGIRVLNRCLVSIRRHTTYKNFEIVIVENNSVDSDTFAYYKEIAGADERVRVVTVDGLTSFNFSRIINYGVSQARGEYLLLLNNDTEVLTPNWIERLLGTCLIPGVGAVGARLLFPDGTIQHAGVTFGYDGPCHLSYFRPRSDAGNMESMQNVRDVSAVTGACLLTRRDTFDAVGGMDEDLTVNYNDVDYCLKVIKNGQRVVYCPLAELLHFESVSRGRETSGAKALRFRTEKGKFMVRWPEAFEKRDPMENPNIEPGNTYERIKWSEPVKGW